MILPTVAPTKANAVWGELAGQLADPAGLDWPTRQYLLPRLVRFAHQKAAATAVDPSLSAQWLDVAPDRLADVLALDLPRPYHLAAARAAAARPGEPGRPSSAPWPPTRGWC